MPILSQSFKGVIITALGVIIISPDGLLTRLITTDHWTIIFWRTFFLSLGMGVITYMVYPRAFWQSYQNIGRAGLLMMVLCSFGTVAFVTAITYTSVANTLIILSTTPLFAVLIGLLFREAVTLRTGCAIVLVAMGVYVISSGHADQGTTWFGDMAAIACAFFLAAGFSVVRYRPGIAVFPVISCGGLLTALLVLPFAQPLSVTQQDMGYLILMGIGVVPIGMALMYIGPKYMPASEVGLILLLEAILGPTWVWLVLGEQPGMRTLVGGGIILVTLMINTLWAMKGASRSIG